MKSFQIALLSIALIAPAYGDDLDQLRRFYSQLQSLSVEARAETGLHLTLLVARGNRFRLQWQGRLVVCDGKQLWNYSPEHKQAVLSPAAAEYSGSVEQLFVALLEQAHLRILERRAETLRVECRLPSSASALGFRSAVLTVRRNDWTPLAVELVSEAGIQRWEVLAFRPNPPVSPRDFTFTPPPDTEVIRLSGPGGP